MEARVVDPRPEDPTIARPHEAEEAAVGDATAPAPLLELEDVEKAYGGRRVLGPLTLRLERGCVGLLGPNGAGKSTFIRLMLGLLRPTRGRVRVLGEAPGPALRRRIGYVPEGDARFPGLNGVQAVVLAGRLVGMGRADAMARAHHVLDHVGLGEARYRDAASYSTGMRQRLKIAQALVHDPALLVLDEPTEGVDPEARDDILEILRGLVREHGTQVLVSTHLLHEVERVATHAVILQEGQVREHGPLAQLRAARERGYEVRLNGPPEPLMRRLAEAGIGHEWLAPVLRVRVDEPAALLRHVADAGLVVRHLAPVELSLDEVFETALRRPSGSAPEVAP